GSLKDSINGEKNARNTMALASTIAGIAFSQTRTTAAHAISFPLTSLYGIEHGIAVAIPLMELIEYTYPNVKEKMDALIRYLGLEGINELINFIKNIMESAGISTRLRDYGVSQDDIEKIAKISMEANIIKLTPGDITFDDVVLMLKKLI
ncbi:MAG: iron-containing alcohol dehydrogenase, partial [Fervidobacterium sp.]